MRQETTGIKIKSTQTLPPQLGKCRRQTHTHIHSHSPHSTFPKKPHEQWLLQQLQSQSAITALCKKTIHSTATKGRRWKREKETLRCTTAGSTHLCHHHHHHHHYHHQSCSVRFTCKQKIEACKKESTRTCHEATTTSASKSFGAARQHWFRSWKNYKWITWATWYEDQTNVFVYNTSPFVCRWKFRE